MIQKPRWQRVRPKRKVNKASSPVPIQDTSTSVADHRRNRSPFVPTEQLLILQALDDIRDEIRALHNTIRQK